MPVLRLPGATARLKDGSTASRPQSAIRMGAQSSICYEHASFRTRQWLHELVAYGETFASGGWFRRSIRPAALLASQALANMLDLPRERRRDWPEPPPGHERRMPSVGTKFVGSQTIC
jgi:hypothetical protein